MTENLRTKKTGILLINLGTPKNCNNANVKQFLKEFLDDPLVVDLPGPLRKLLLHLWILPFRSARSAKAYSAIWDPQKGSPLMHHSQNLSQKMQTALGEEYVVVLGMRYGDPSLKEAIKILHDAKCQNILVLPLFPQYSIAATGSALAQVSKNMQTHFEVRESFYSDPGYIGAQAALIEPLLRQKNPDKILFSYHSLPVRHIRKSKSDCQSACFADFPCKVLTDKNRQCYRAQCYETSRLLAQKLGLAQDQFEVVFQSRLGRAQWIGPDIQIKMAQLIEQGVKNLLIACPSFVADCLETLEEIGIRAKEHWRELGGNELTLVTSLNDDPVWVKALSQMIRHFRPTSHPYPSPLAGEGGA